MKKALVLIAVAAVLFSSGCLGFGAGKTITTGSGVQVNVFEPDFPDLEAGDTFDLYLEVENIGGADATNTYAHLYDIDTTEWGVTEPSQSIGTLESPDEFSETPGEIGEARWDMTAPVAGISKGVTYTYTPKVRLLYGYQTVATANIPLMKKDEYTRLKERDMLNVPTVVTDVSKGPLAVTISARSPIVIDDYDEDTVEFRVNVDILEKGGVIDPEWDTSNSAITSEQMDKMKLTITASGVDSTPIDCAAFNTAEEVTLRRGASLVYTCELKAKEFSATTTVPVSVVLEYNYLQDLTTELRVMSSD